MAPANWNTGDHKLVTSTTNGHDTADDAVFDDPSPKLLRRFYAITVETRDQIVDEKGWHGVGGRPYEKAGKSGDLSGFLIARHGTSDPALDDRYIEMLKKWFDEGMPKAQKVFR